MKRKDSLDGFKYLSEVHRSQFDERRKYEWKIVFSVLSFYVLSVAAAYTKGTELPSGWIYIGIVWIAFILFAVIISKFLCSFHDAHNKNKNFAENAERNIQRLLRGEDPKILPSVYSNEKTISNWSLHGQIVIIFYFAIFASILISLKIIK